MNVCSRPEDKLDQMRQGVKHPLTNSRQLSRNLYLLMLFAVRL